MTLSLSPGELVLAALDELVATIQALELPATRDPGDFQPPGVIVAPPTITGPHTLAGVGLTVPVWIVADGPGREAQDWSLAAAADVLTELGENEAAPTLWTSPINPDGLPAYLVTVRLTIAQEG